MNEPASPTSTDERADASNDNPRHEPGGSEPIAIVGVGCAFPNSPNVDAYWRSVRDGRDAIREVPDTHWQPDDYFDADPTSPDMTYGRRGGFLDPVPFDTLEFGIAPKNLEATDTTQLFAMLAARDALRDAGFAVEPNDQTGRQFNRKKTSVVLGVTGALELVIPLGARLAHPHWRSALRDAGVSDAVADDVVSRIGDRMVEWQENSFPGLLGNVAAGRVANRFDLGGTNCVVDAACASSLSALHLAMLELQSGRADVALSGGVDTFNDIFMYMCFSKTPALSPSGESRPFDLAGDGTILGEGAGVVVLKRLSDAERDGDPIRAVIRGIGSSSDGRGNAIYAPSASGQQRALRAAYDDAGVSPATIELFEAHGTGTKVGDATEVDSMTAVYRDSGQEGTWCALGSVKSMIGHTKAAAGIAGLIKTVLALEKKVLPPTLKVREPLANLALGSAPVYINTQARPWISRPDHPRRAALSAFGFGGSNFHCVLEEYDPTLAAPDWSGEVAPFAVSGATRDAVSRGLESLFTALADEVEAHPDNGWQLIRAAASASRHTFSTRDAVRALIRMTGASTTDAVSLAAEIRALKTGAITAVSQLDADNAVSPDPRIHVGEGAAPGRLAVLFPGQGSQRPGMLKDLACTFPDVAAALRDANDTMGTISTEGPTVRALTDLMYPPAGFSSAERNEQAQALRNTAFAQPALGAVELGAWKVLSSFGVNAEAFAGHSFGELVALSAAGRLEPSTLLSLAKLRGQLMAGDGSDRGSMLAVKLGEAELQRWLDAANESKTGGLPLVIANLNGPTQSVLSGETEAIIAAEAALKADGFQVIRLPVAGAFHSPLMAEASQPFAAALEDVDLSGVDDQTPMVFANATAQPYPSDTREARELLARQLTAPVRFGALIETLYASGFRTFIEVGPGRILTGMTRSILAEFDEPSTVHALDDSNGKGTAENDVATLLCNLAAAGHLVDLSTWDPYEAPPIRKRSPATVYIAGANAKTSRPPRPALSQAEPVAANPTASVPPTMIQNDSFAPTAADHPAAPMRVDAAAEHANPAAQSAVPPPSAPQEHVGTPPPAALGAPASMPFQPGPTGTVAEEVIRTLARMQEQTADLHRHYLDGVNATQQSIYALVHQLGQSAPEAAAAPQPLVSPSVSVAPPAAATPPQIPTPAPTSDLPSEPDAAPRAAQAAVATAPAASPQPDLSALVITVVADKTGYPQEMLSATMELDADLGIDSIKRVEILSALQEAIPGASEPSPDTLGELVTLGDVITLMSAGLPDAGSAGQTTASDTMPAPNVDGGAPANADTSRIVLNIVADKTGYPTEMLQPEMELDADLGIDSIKRVEILSAVEEQLPGVTPPDPQLLAELRTLGDVIAFASPSDAAGLTAPASNASPPPRERAADGDGDGQDLQALLLSIVGEKTGYPADVLGLEMHLDADLGIDSIKRVEILSALEEALGSQGIADPEAIGQLDTLGSVLDLLQSQGASSSAMSADASGATSLSPSPQPAHADASTPSESLPTDASQTLASNAGVETADAPLLVQAPVVVPLNANSRALLNLDQSATFWVVGGTEDSPSALGDEICRALGSHGLTPRTVRWDEPLDPTLPTSGIVFVAPTRGMDSTTLVQKATSLAQAFAKAPKATGTRLVAGITSLGGHFGLDDAPGRACVHTAALGGIIKSLSHEWADGSAKVIDISPDADDIANVAADIADELLLDGPLEVGVCADRRLGIALENVVLRESSATRLSPGAPVLITGGARGITARFALALAERTGCLPVLLGRTAPPAPEPAWLEDAVSEADIKSRLSRDGGLKTPADINRACAEILSAREVSASLREFEARGLGAKYISVDIRDGDALRDVIAQVETESGDIQGVVHGAGVLADRLIEDKTEAQLSAVMDTKVGPLGVLLDRLGPTLKLVGLFSSSTARFGRRGQTDYAAANEVLNKTAQALAAERPDIPVVSFNWGPWEGGMVTPALARLFQAEGIGLIGLNAGVDLAVNALLRDPIPGPVELVVGAASSETTAAHAPRSVNDDNPARQDRPTGTEPTLQRARSHHVSLLELPLLEAHVLAGRGVLPLVISNEWLIQAALHHNPGLYFHGVDNLQVLSAVRVNGEETVEVEAAASLAVPTGDALAAHATLGAASALNVRGEVILDPVKALPIEPLGITLSPEQPEGVAPAWRGRDLYTRDVLFHGPELQAIASLRTFSKAGISAVIRTSPSPEAWLRQPWRSSWVTDPLAIDGSFQLMVLWCLEFLGAHSLPTFVRQYRQYTRRFPSEGVIVDCTVEKASTHRVVSNIGFYAMNGTLLAHITGYECVVDASLARAFAERTLDSGTPANFEGDDIREARGHGDD